MSEPLPASATVGVIGAGTMGAGIAWVAAAAGHTVLLHDVRNDAVDDALAEIGNRLQRSVDKGRIEADDRAAILERIVPVDALDAFASAKLVIEAIAERLDLKRTLFSQLEEIVDEDTALATNTSSLSVTAVAGGLRLPERVVGMHFFNPAPLMPLVEIVVGAESDPAIVDRISATAAAWGKSPVRCTSTPGFIVNRVARPFYSEALRILSEGVADAATIDAIVTGAGGFKMGPFELMDLVGLDVNLAVTRSVYEQTLDPRFAPNVRQQALVDAGHLGRKSGRGWFDYETSHRPPAGHPSGTVPQRAAIPSDSHYDGLADRLRSAGITIERTGDSGWLTAGDVSLMQTDGRPASLVNAAHVEPSTIVFDSVGDWTSASAIAVAAPPWADDATLSTAIGLFQAAELAVYVLPDAPGLVLSRIVAQLVSVAADAAGERIAIPADIDTAMRLGTNYPRGPFEWAKLLGSERVVMILDNLRAFYGEDRYRTAGALRTSVLTGLPLTETLPGV